MAEIVSSRIIENTKLAHGYRVHLEFTFDDGEVKQVKFRTEKKNEAAKFLKEKEKQVKDNKVYMKSLKERFKDKVK